MSRTKKPARAPHYDIEYVRAAAARQWVAIITSIAGIDPDSLSGKPCPCPKCGGNDRFRFTNMHDGGSSICNQCFRAGGDGFATLTWLTGRKFGEVLALVADYLGIAPTEQPAKSNGKGGKSASYNKHAPIDPAESLEFVEWDAPYDGNDMLARVWCTWKEPVSIDAVKAVGGRIAKYQGRHDVIALPIWGEELDAAAPVGWCLYNLTGGELPRVEKNKETGKWETVELLKVKLTHGSKPGIIADLSRLKTARVVVKVEGPSDLLGLLSLADLPGDHAVLTNANGAVEKPAEWMLRLIAGQPADGEVNECNTISLRDSALVIHDADIPGQNGAIGYQDTARNEYRPGWATQLAPRIPTRNVSLPFEIAETHGKDLRDFLNMPSTFVDLQALINNAELVPGDKAVPADNEPAKSATETVMEEDDDPHYLARVNLERYATLSGGGKIRYWREQFYTWKPARACYRVIHRDEFSAKVTSSIKAEFDRQWAEAYERYREWQKSASYNADADKGPPKAHKVTNHLVKNVIAATASLVLVPSSVELMTWLEGSAREQRPYIAMLNGVIDIDKLLSDADEDECILSHSPNWFSTVRVPYRFDPEAKCPRWDAFLEKSLEQDPERIKILQEWAGYCLTPDTSYQKFLAMEGEGGNGKSVFMAGLQAMLGGENCEHIGLERLIGGDFDVGQTFGKLANFCADVGEIDKLCEGNLKSFTSGDTISAKRKFLGNLKFRPTARLLLSFNNRPRFSDRSQGVWRRMLLIPWRVQIAPQDRVLGMDQPEWWERTGELPGMFNWALIGLHRLRAQRRFTSSALITEAIEDYQDESNPARSFLREYFEEATNTSIKTSVVYHFYCRWAESTGHRPMNERTFGKEVKRTFPNTERKKLGNRQQRYHSYTGLNFNTDEILGEQTHEGELF